MTRKSILHISLLVWAATLHVGQSDLIADTITFETLPGGTPSDGLEINTQFEATFGVTFALENGDSPLLAQVGAPLTAFQGFNLLPDEPAPGINVGSFFLTDDDVVSGSAPALIVSYTNPVAAASGILLDIDGTEAWQIQARDSSNVVIDTLNLSANNTLDGSATQWSFNHASADIFSIRMVQTGNQALVGLAFDNFSPSSAIPEPSSLAVLGLTGATILRRRKRCA
jgi:hypothetical protein